MAEPRRYYIDETGTKLDIEQANALLTEHDLALRMEPIEPDPTTDAWPKSLLPINPDYRVQLVRSSTRVVLAERECPPAERVRAAKELLDRVDDFTVSNG